MRASNVLEAFINQRGGQRKGKEKAEGGPSPETQATERRDDGGDFHSRNQEIEQPCNPTHSQNASDQHCGTNLSKTSVRAISPGLARSPTQPFPFPRAISAPKCSSSQCGERAPEREQGSQDPRNCFSVGGGIIWLL